MKVSICLAAILLSFAQTVRCVSVVPRGELYAKTGATVTLTCAAGGVGGLESENVSWLKGDIGSSVPVDSLNDSRISTNSNNLTITNYHNSEHGGMYYCTAEGPRDHYRLSCPTHVQHARILANNASIPVETQVVPVIVNSTASLVCDVPPSWPPALVYWERDGVRLDIAADPRFSLLPSGNLYITGATEDDQAQYRCFTTNPVTMVTRHSKVIYQLTVTAPPANSTAPTFTIAPVDTVAITGSRVIIECLGQAHPTPDLEWIIIHNVHFPKEGGVLPTGGLQFDSVTSEDAGTYRCRLSNSVGIAYTQISLEIKEPPSLSSAPQPRLQLPLDGAVATNNTLITCAASGSPPLEVLLSHDSHVIRAGRLPEGSSEREVVLIHSVIEEGYYQCLASNDYGCEQWTTLATFTPSLPTTTESPASVSSTSFKESSTTDSFTASTEKPSNQSTITQRIITTMSEALTMTETTEAPHSKGKQTTTQGEIFTTTNEEGPTTSQGESIITTTNEEGPMTSQGPAAPTTEGEPATSSEGPTTTNIEGATSQSTVSEKIATTTNSEPATHSTSFEATTLTITTDTPTGPPLTTPPPPPPMLDVMTNGDMFTVLQGGSLTLECHVSEGGAGTLVLWYFNEVKLPDVSVTESNTGRFGDPRLSSQLTFHHIELSHAGQYVCEAYSPANSQTVRAPMQVNVLPLLQAPLNLTLVDGVGRLAISWLPNPLNEGQHIVGYKINWDHPSRLVQSAATSVPISNMQYTTESINLSLEYGVLVWAFNELGDGLPAKATWTPKTTIISTTETRTECVAIEISPTQVLLEWPEQVGVSEGVENIIVATCQMSQTSRIIQVPMATNSYRLQHLLPFCSYHFSVGVANCYVNTAPGHVNLSARVHRHDNGSIQLDWFLPEELQAAKGLSIDVRVVEANSGWVPIEPGHTPHIPTHLLNMEHSIEFRLRVDNWEGHSIITIPSQTSPTSTTVAVETEPESSGHGFQFSEIGLIYGLIFGVLVVACATVVIMILVLKYIQMTRRENDKVTNHRDKHMEEFRRLSLKRSSVNSIKKDPNYYQQ